MANSTCPKCDSHNFEIKVSEQVAGTTRIVKFVQCSSCGAVIGTIDNYNVPILLGKIADKLGINNFLN